MVEGFGEGRTYGEGGGLDWGFGVWVSGALDEVGTVWRGKGWYHDQRLPFF